MHRMVINAQWEDQYKPVVFPFLTTTDDERYHQGDHVELLMGERSTPAVIQSVSSVGHLFEIVLRRA
jgi:hypothetical protein